MADENLKIPSIRPQVRPNTIDPRALQVDVFPYDAFEFDKTVDPPLVRLRSPWVFDVGELIAEQVTGSVKVEGNTEVAITDFPIVEVATRPDQTLVWYNKLNEGIFVKERSLEASETLVTTADLRNLFVTADLKVGGISIGQAQGVWIDGVNYITDAVVAVAFVDYTTVYCVLRDDLKVYKYNLLTSTKSLVVDNVVQWITSDCHGDLYYQTTGGIYKYNGISSSLILSGAVYYSAFASENLLLLQDLSGNIYSYDGVLIDSGVNAYKAIYCDGLYVIDPVDLTLSVNLNNAVIEGLTLTGETFSGNFIATSVTDSITLVALNTEEMKKVFVGDIISGGGFTNAEVVYKGGNYIRLSIAASEDHVNFSFSVAGTRLTLNANQVLIPGTVTATEIEAGTITANEIAAGTITTNELAADVLTAGNIIVGSDTLDDVIDGIDTDVATAQATADGKNTIYYQATAPALGVQTGDIWYDTDDGNTKYLYNGSSWAADYTLKSSNFSTGVSGWGVQSNGDAEFNNIISRGFFSGSDSYITSINQPLYFPAGTVVTTVTNALDQYGLIGDTWNLISAKVGNTFYTQYEWGPHSPLGSYIHLYDYLENQLILAAGIVTLYDVSILPAFGITHGIRTVKSTTINTEAALSIIGEAIWNSAGEPAPTIANSIEVKLGGYVVNYDGTLVGGYRPIYPILSAVINFNSSGYDYIRVYYIYQDYIKWIDDNVTGSTLNDNDSRNVGLHIDF